MQRGQWVAFFSVLVIGYGSSEAQSPPEKLIQAFNRHDPAAMSELVSEDFELFYVVDGEVSLGTSGPESLREEMESYFRSVPNIKAEIVERVDGDRFVSMRELVSWTQNGTRRAQSAIAVYQIEGELIQRVWYFEAEPAPEASSEPAKPDARSNNAGIPKEGGHL